MKDLVKSMVSFSWALSLLGVKQAVSLVTPGSRSSGMGNVLDPVTDTAVAQLDESMQGIFRSGDNIQSKMVDMMMGMANPASWNVARWVGDCGKRWPSPGAADSGPSYPTVNAATAGSVGGWGPMPGDTPQ